MEVPKVRVASKWFVDPPIWRNPDMEGPDGWDMNHSNHLEIQGTSAVIKATKQQSWGVVLDLHHQFSRFFFWQMGDFSQPQDSWPSEMRGHFCTQHWGFNQSLPSCNRTRVLVKSSMGECRLTTGGWNAQNREVSIPPTWVCWDRCRKIWY